MFKTVIRARSLSLARAHTRTTRQFQQCTIVRRPSELTQVSQIETVHASNNAARQSDRQAPAGRSRKDIMEFLYKSQQQPVPTSKPNTILTNCPHCLGIRKASFAATVNLETGSYNCKTCHSKGSWNQFSKTLQKKLRQNEISEFKLYNTSDMLGGPKAPHFSRSLEEIEGYPQHLSPELKEEWAQRYKFDPSVLDLYKVGVAEYTDPSRAIEAAQNGEEVQKTECITFPQTTLTYAIEDSGDIFKVETVRVKACSTEQPNDVVTYDPPSVSESRSAGLFGYHTVPSDASTVIVTRRELDAMAAYQATGLPSVSLPTVNYQLQESVLPLLERFSKIYLWLDDDVDGQMASERFAHKLGESRCLLVSSNTYNEPDGPRNAHEALVQERDIREMLQSARRIKHDEIMDFKDLREEVLREILNPEQTRGIPSTDLPQLNQILKGHRPGELTILTGPTGAGKTTIISQLSLDYCKSGVPTLWGSFEILNKRLAKKMLYQLAGKDLSTAPQEFDGWADQFEQLPLYFLKFFSTTAIKDVLKACKHAVYAYDTRHIILDNLQFMLSQQGRSSLDRWELQDEAVAELRRFATEQDVHITLVVHPRKDAGEALEINSVFGSAKVTQEADNVIIIQKGVGARYLDIKKNRFDGTLGTVPYIFEPEALKIRGLTEEETTKLKNSGARRSSETRVISKNFRSNSYK